MVIWSRGRIDWNSVGGRQVLRCRCSVVIIVGRRRGIVAWYGRRTRNGRLFFLVVGGKLLIGVGT